ncbi:MAG TPA: peptide-methionine (R)-S-oxide reductase MsrB [Pseudomonadales bacterium]|jgi:peptide-methionine (R)-S-oxide reductase
MEKIKQSEQAWREQLSADEYRVTREHGTERAFTGRYWDHKAEGQYCCVCCGLPLFDSATKYDSGSGWPSFWQPLEAAHIATHTDRSHGMERTETLCARCDAHLGHVFPDGPEPSGLRFCINSLSLRFTPKV